MLFKIGFYDIFRFRNLKMGNSERTHNHTHKQEKKKLKRIYFMWTCSTYTHTFLFLCISIARNCTEQYKIPQLWFHSFGDHCNATYTPSLHLSLSLSLSHTKIHKAYSVQPHKPNFFINSSHKMSAVR